MRYYTLKRDIKSDRKQLVVDNILKLKRSLENNIPKKRLDANLLIATWNIRDFDSNKFGHGPRLAESFYYIAQIISAFDLVAVQEVSKDLRALNKLMFVLGPQWDFITTDVTSGRSGNQERMTFIYDTRRVSFKNVAGEVVLPKNRLIKGDVQFARTPFVVSFQSGWSKFSLCTVHIYFGADSGAKLERRKSEIEGIAKFLKKKADNDKQTLIVLGDFNIVDHEHETMKKLIKNGFDIPEQIRNKPVGTNTFQTKHYDQIGIRSKSEFFKLGENNDSAGAINFYRSVMRKNQFDEYREFVEKSVSKQIANKKQTLTKLEAKATPDLEKIQNAKEALADLEGVLASDQKLLNYYYKVWKTFQISDHLPMWVEIKTDHSTTYLESIP
ncbi:endonuclease/exonuclease/phosphatase family protein [Flavobacteriaceae bacterium S356]|uniref:Endonuclease/exonuclease/phosphatase family protein n=1 Tax=Asprobacillus argus TaxID=3076534 RepID=A0ABU3LBX3_9FLAO|nr:endonuclease/exonuclease/phosphatase family protein [Flavobacteriaceae bacterium S356]